MNLRALQHQWSARVDRQLPDAYLMEGSQVSPSHAITPAEVHDIVWGGNAEAQNLFREHFGSEIELAVQVLGATYSNFQQLQDSVTLDTRHQPLLRTQTPVGPMRGPRNSGWSPGRPACALAVSRPFRSRETSVLPELLCEWYTRAVSRQSSNISSNDRLKSSIAGRFSITSKLAPALRVLS